MLKYCRGAATDRAGNRESTYDRAAPSISSIAPATVCLATRFPPRFYTDNVLSSSQAKKLDFVLRRVIRLTYETYEDLSETEKPAFVRK